MRDAKVYIIAALALLAALGWWQFLDIRLHAALAEEQTRFFDEIVEQAIEHKTLPELAADMESIKIYYPSGSKQRVGSHLDRMVERSRNHALEKLQEKEKGITH
jgi:hypothetical protein